MVSMYRQQSGVIGNIVPSDIFETSDSGFFVGPEDIGQSYPMQFPNNKRDITPWHRDAITVGNLRRSYIRGVSTTFFDPGAYQRYQPASGPLIPNHSNRGSGLSMWGWFAVDSLLGTFQSAMGFFDVNSSNTYLYVYLDSSNIWNASGRFSGTDQILTGPAAIPYVPIFIGVKIEPFVTDRWITTAYFNGEPAAISGSNVVADPIAGFDRFSFGQLDRSSPVFDYSGHIAAAGWVPRSLSDAEFRALWSPESRWDLYRKPDRHYFLIDAAVAPGPILSLPTESAITQTTATLGYTTDTAGATTWVVSTQSATTPSIPNIKAGQDHLGAPADYSANHVPTVGINSFAATGLVANTGYFNYFVQNDGADDSLILESGAWSTLPVGALANLYQGANQVNGMQQGPNTIDRMYQGPNLFWGA